MNLKDVVWKIQGMLKKQATEVLHARRNRRSVYRGQSHNEPNELFRSDVRDAFKELELEQFDQLLEVMRERGIILKDDPVSIQFDTASFKNYISQWDLHNTYDHGGDKYF